MQSYKARYSFRGEWDIFDFSDNVDPFRIRTYTSTKEMIMLSSLLQKTLNDVVSLWLWTGLFFSWSVLLVAKPRLKFCVESAPQLTPLGILFFLRRSLRKYHQRMFTINQ